MLRSFYICTLVTLVLGVTAAVSEAQQKGTSTKAATSEKKAEGSPVNTTTIRFQTGQNLAGGLMDTDELQINSTFGDVKIPLHTIAGVKFAEKGDPSSTVVMRNGDIITGEVLLGEVKVATAWGEATINTSSVSSIVFTPGLDWVQARSADQSKWTLANKGGAGSSRSNSTANSTRNLGR